MDVLLYFGSAFLLASNAVTLILLLQQRKKEKKLTKDAQELLHDLTAHGNALVRLERIAPADVFLRSPR